jgi:hypothetical protein
MKSRLAKLLPTAVLVALAAAAIAAGPAAAARGGNGSTGSSTTTTTTGTTTSPTVEHYCASGYTLVGTTSSYYKLAYDKNADGYVCVKVARKSTSYADDFSQLIML